MIAQGQGHDKRHTCTVESRDYAPPPLCMLTLGKSGEGAYSRDRYISVLQPLPTIECHVGTRSLHFFWLFDGQNSMKNDQVRHNNIMTQIASLLAVATVFIGLWTLISTFYCQGGGEGGGLYAR